MRRKRYNKNKRKIMSDINVTPFVDVLLVLLIIFMVAAPLINGNIKVNLPKGSAKKVNPYQENKIIITIKNNGLIYLEDENIKSQYLAKKLIKLTNSDLTSKIFIKADKNLNYGTVMDIIKTINDAGFASASLITEIK
jgi:biopolymer transport protein TolR